MTFDQLIHLFNTHAHYYWVRDGIQFASKATDPVKSRPHVDAAVLAEIHPHLPQVLANYMERDPHGLGFTWALQATRDLWANKLTYFCVLNGSDGKEFRYFSRIHYVSSVHASGVRVCADVQDTALLDDHSGDQIEYVRYTMPMVSLEMPWETVEEIWKGARQRLETGIAMGLSPEELAQAMVTTPRMDSEHLPELPELDPGP